MLQIGKAIIMVPRGLLRNLCLLGEVGRGKSKNGLGLIKKVENIMKAGNWGKTDSIVQKVLIDEAW